MLLRYRRIGGFLLACGYLCVCACAPLQRNPEAPAYRLTPGTQKYAIEPVALKNQTLKIAVRVAGGHVAARLAAPLLCMRSGSAEYTGTQRVSYALAVTDDVIRWSAFGAAGAVAALVAVGLARGQELGRGAAIIGIWSVPLAGIGTYETLRERQALETIKPALRPFKPKEAPCPGPKSTVTARITGAPGDAVKLTLDLEWRRVGLARVNELQPGESLVPAVAGADGVVAAQLLRRPGPQAK